MPKTKLNTNNKRKESDIKKAILSFLKTRNNCFAWVNHTTGIPNGHGGFRKNFSAGISDICGIYKSYPFALEVKTETGVLSDKQKTFLFNFKKAGGFAEVARSVEDALIVLNTIDNYLKTKNV